ncbi:DUF4167 domain-containing protein [Sphingosinicella sp. LY1275]|uniref:DUF4167 domain-containing protein n=1 Tax=Sphingosinicella sp. LY1275 TaxID=3095379 RepID=UPI002ADEC547|nr:DUF4167 domain-containing protein [Sphingosinicella sp. LY1275]MEA1014602.1 DUF4167 domain-containing protein [Sphingosinicella sp. LY1275]
MINNRQNGRRRGRGGGPRSPGSVPSQGNRQDNRSRGNAAQLHEKYKALARDTQLAGDRVQTEYYLQFADHYFRVLNETRARFEEQRPRRDDFNSYEDEDQDEAVNADSGDEQDEQQEDRGDREQRQDRNRGRGREQRAERQDREPRPERQDREPPRSDREDRPERAARDEAEPRAIGELRPRRPRRTRDDNAEQGDERISLDVLPPAIAPVPTNDDADEAPKPRRRTRRPRADEGDAEIAPAA